MRNLYRTLLAYALALTVASTGHTQVREKQLSSTFTNSLIREDGSNDFTADQSMGGNKLTNLADGTDPADAVTKSQLDAISAGLDPKESVRLCSDGILDDNADISGSPTYNNTGGTSGRGQITATLAVSGTFNLDGVAVNSGDRVMLHDEGEVGGLGGDANGVWEVTISGTSLTLDRATDFDEDAEVTAGAYFFVEEGTTCGGKGYVLTTPDPITIGGASGTALTFSVFSSISFGTSGVTTVNAGDSASVGSGEAARVDHEHAVATAAASSLTPDLANAEGVSTSLARADHIHNVPAAVVDTILAQDTVAAEGTDASFARSDHSHGLGVAAPTASIDAGDAASEGTSTDFVRADHQHAVNTGTASAASVGDTSTEGSSTALARADHTHAHTAGTAVNVGTANATGASGNFADAEHVHDSPQPSDADKNVTASVTTGTNETTGLTITNSPALASYLKPYVNGVLYTMGDGVDTEDFYMSGDACSTPRALTAVVASDVMCQGDNLPFNLDATDRLALDYLTFVNN